MRTDDVTVVIPTIGPRAHLLDRAVRSVWKQTYGVDLLLTETDRDHSGAWATRARGLSKVTTKWTAFLDDDDEFLPHHLELLMTTALEQEADMVWGWFEVVGGSDPFPHYRGKPYDLAQPHVVPITYLAKTDLLQASPGFQPDSSEGGSWDVQDMPVINHLAAHGKLVAIPDTTWLWHHHGANTSGLPTRW